tara:strand:- start:56 stop:511 length:456 start_codon:yes stop_codon:yes gene_type:complete
LIDMSLENKIMNDIKSAMLMKDSLRLEVLRAIKSEILLVKTDKQSTSLTEKKEIEILQKLLKQRTDAAKIYNEQGRTDLAENEKNQAAVVSTYLPKPYTIEQIEDLVDSVMQELDITSVQQMGKLISIVIQRAKGRADGKTLSDCVKKKLI